MLPAEKVRIHGVPRWYIPMVEVSRLWVQFDVAWM